MDVVKIEKLDHQGRGIAHLNGCIVFVSNALVEEEVEIEIVKRKKNVLEARVIRYLYSSPERVISKCPYYTLCGGCDLLHMDYDAQLVFKQNKVCEVLSRYAHLDHVVQPIVASEEPFCYRNKVTFQVNEKIGFYKKQSYDIVPVEKCFLIHEKMNEILQVFRTCVSLDGIQKFVIRDMGENAVMLTIYLQKKKDFQIYVDIFSDYVDSLNVIYENKTYFLIGDGHIIAKLGKYCFLVSPTSFFQVHLKQTVKLYDKICTYCALKPEDIVLDLYCGTGTIGIYLSAFCHSVLGIEINEEAVRDAKRNKEINQVSNIKFLSGDVKEVLKKEQSHPDVVVVDPPRAGLDGEVVQMLLESLPKRVVYVSCDVMTLARDLKLLMDAYEVLEVTPFDMFPNTSHVECVCVLKRR